MTGEIPQPERYVRPEARAFNVGAMSDEEITIIFRALDHLGDKPFGPDGPDHEISISDSLWEKLADDVRDLAARDPERVKGMVQGWATSEHAVDREFAASTTRSLIRYDYAFTRDTLVNLFVSEERLIGGISLLEAAMWSIENLMRDELTPEQIADFNASITAQGHDPLSPRSVPSAPPYPAS